MASRDIPRRLDALEQATGSTPTDAQIARDAAEVEAKIAAMASRISDAERIGMEEWWACCRKRARTDPFMAKIFAGFLPSDLDL